MPSYASIFSLTTILTNTFATQSTTTTIAPSTIPLVTFDGTPATTHEWSSLNDPVMGGKSDSTFSISSSSQTGIFDGEVVDVPFLKAPGFVQAYTQFRGRLGGAEGTPFRGGADGTPFPDVRGCRALEVTAALPGGEDYSGFKISFGTARSGKFTNCGHHSYGYKAALPLDGGVTGLQKVVVPFDEFSDCNDDATGLPIVTCQEDEDVCPNDDVFNDMKTIAIWGEGVAGKFQMEITSIEATDCAPAVVSETLGEDIIALATFDGADKATTREWETTNDPVMGGKSTGTFTIENGLGHWEGECAIVPSLDAPGFISMGTIDISTPFPDVSYCEGLKLEVRSHIAYDGFSFSFGTEHPPEGEHYSNGYKARLNLVVSDDFQNIMLPFNTFTDLYNGSGDPITTCEEDSKYCPNESTLKNMKRLRLSGSAVEGKVDLDIKNISAYGCKAESEVVNEKRRYLRA